MLFNSPLSAEKADRIIDLLTLAEGDRTVDAGCGTGEFMIRMIERKRVRGLGIDRQGESISAAKEAASGRVDKELWEFREADLQEISLEMGSFDLAVCIGSTHAFGSGEAAFPNAIRELARIARPGALVLLGEGYWKRDPEPDYLELIGEPVGVYRSHAENIWFGESQGLIPLYAAVSSDDEWDHFEWSHKLKIERECGRPPDGSDHTARLERSRRWRDGYLKWGRSTMGFGFYLFQTPAVPHPEPVGE